MELPAHRFGDKKPRNNQLAWVKYAGTEETYIACFNVHGTTWDGMGDFRHCRSDDLWAPIECPVLVKGE